MTTSLSPTKKRKVYTLFVVVSACLVCQFAATKKIGEPYPAVQMPGFHGNGGNNGRSVVSRQPIFTYIFESGETREFSHVEIFASLPTSHQVTLPSIFFPARGNDEPILERAVELDGLIGAMFPHFKEGQRNRHVRSNREELTKWLIDQGRRLSPEQKPVRIIVRWSRKTFDVSNGAHLLVSEEEIGRDTFEVTS